MRYSQSTELAIDSLLYMASHNTGADFSVEQVAKAQSVSPSYLAKVFQQLVKSGILRSHRGAKGGYMLGRPLGQITLKDIATVFEGSSPLYECGGSVKHCALDGRCLVIATFSAAEKAMQEVLSKVSLQDVVAHVAQVTGGTGGARVSVPSNAVVAHQVPGPSEVQTGRWPVAPTAASQGGGN